MNEKHDFKIELILNNEDEEYNPVTISYNSDYLETMLEMDAKYFIDFGIFSSVALSEDELDKFIEGLNKIRRDYKKLKTDEHNKIMIGRLL